jgi:hypothetical protein
MKYNLNKHEPTAWFCLNIIPVEDKIWNKTMTKIPSFSSLMATVLHPSCRHNQPYTAQLPGNQQ